MTAGNTNPQMTKGGSSHRSGLVTPIRLPLTVHEGHLIAEISGRRALVDTGCPVTVGSDESLSVGACDILLADSFCGITVASISELVGCPFEILIGMDVLSRFETTFSLRKAAIILGEEFGSTADVLVQGTWFGVPTMPISVNGKSHDVIFDTGAPTTYLSERLVSDFEFVETRTDFYPFKGRFENAIHKGPVTIGSKTIALELAAMKGSLASMLDPSRVTGIIGTELLKYADVTLSVARNTIAIDWHNSP